MKELFHIEHMNCHSEEQTELSECNFHLYQGEIVGIVGFRNSGKELLFRILRGEQEYDSGRVFLEEKLLTGTRFPEDFGVACVSERVMLEENMSVADNIFLIRKPRGFRFFSRDRLNIRLARRHFEEFGLAIDPQETAGNLTMQERCSVEILKAYLHGARLVILDHIVSALSKEECDALFEFICRLKKKKVSFVLSGYHFKTFSKYCDRVFFMLHGQLKQVWGDKNPLYAMYHEERHRRYADSRVRLQLSHVYMRALKDFSLSLRYGEILAVIDFEKTTNDEILELLHNPEICVNGSVQLNGEPLSARESAKRIVFTELTDLTNAVIPDLSLEDNLCLSCFSRIHTMGFVSKRRTEFVRNEFLKWYPQYSAPQEEQCRKVNDNDRLAILLYRLILHKPELVICTNPIIKTFEGNDAIIIRAFEELLGNGTSVLILSDNPEQDCKIADRVCFVRGGIISFVDKS